MMKYKEQNTRENKDTNPISDIKYIKRAIFRISKEISDFQKNVQLVLPDFF